MSEHKYRTTPEPIKGMPPGIPYIIGNEAAERFSYYGMRTILTVFMFKYLYLMSNQVQAQMSEAEATANYHTFATWVYLFPIAGAIISDAVTGKYPIIMGVSVLYCLGHLSLALMGAPGLSPENWLWLGLFLIAVGSGGIKPCVSAHVGDQFGPRNQHLLEKVYQWFYFSINLGSTISTLLTPYLLEWYGPHVAFGVPGVLMAVATFTFWLGRNKFVHVPPAGWGFLKDVFSKRGLLTIGKLMLVYLSISVFWALFDQTGSAWVLQAEDMDREWLGVQWLSSQIQAVNPILVMLLIPVFQFGIYPAVNKVFRLTPLRKMSIGLFVAAGSFALAATIQHWIDTGYRPSIGWQILAYVILTSAEVMVSITGLEFSYTQAPKSMKSIVMAVWLFSVSLGNLVTAVVNNVIQVPGVNSVVSEAAELEPANGTKTLGGLWLAKAEAVTSGGEPDRETTTQARLAGHDRRFNTRDDILLTYDRYGNLTGVKTSANSTLKAAQARIDAAFFESARGDAEKTLPDDEAGNQLLSGLEDANGVALRYDRVTRNRYRIVSAGPDEQFGTRWDIVLHGTVHRANPADSSADSPSEDRPLTWRERRIIELKGEEGRREVKAARGDIPETKITSEITVGGHVTLQGADYFWFWTYLMLGAAVVFVPIAYFYKDQTQLQGEGTEEPVPPGDRAIPEDAAESAYRPNEDEDDR